jgi:hypothetical protein
MTGGLSRESPAPGHPLPPPGSPETLEPASPVQERLKSAWEPTLPDAPAKPAAPMVDHDHRHRAPTTWYRSDQARHRSVHRRANPLWRRLARGIIALSFIGAAGFGVYLGARELQDYLERDRLPSPGVELASYRATSFQIRSVAPAPVLDGTLTLDTVSRAFEFVGRGNGDQAGLQIVSADGSTMYVRQDAGAWHLGVPDEPVVDELGRVLPYLLKVDTTDDVLPKQLRQSYVELIDRASEGVDENQLTRYEMSFNTSGFSDDFPLQWQSYQAEAIPGIVVDPAVPVTVWTDQDSMVVRLRDEKTGWSWQRLTYSDEPFIPLNPSGAVVEIAASTSGD